MLFILSPAKRIISSEYGNASRSHSQPDLVLHAAKLVSLLKSYSPNQLSDLLKVSDQLAVLNAGRYAEWSVDHSPENSRQAIFSYDGDVYRGLNPQTFDDLQLDYAQRHVRVLSGLYGILRPLDLIQPYRLEMGTRMPNPCGNSLYAFWRSLITNGIQKEFERQGTSVLVNLASDEYARAIDPKRLDASLVTPLFQEWHGGKWEIIPIHAKRARGLMARYAIINRIDNVEMLKAFDSEGYAYDQASSDAGNWVFRRR